MITEAQILEVLNRVKDRHGDDADIYFLCKVVRSYIKGSLPRIDPRDRRQYFKRQYAEKMAKVAELEALRAKAGGSGS